jgi:hypothetical protein
MNSRLPSSGSTRTQTRSSSARRMRAGGPKAPPKSAQYRDVRPRPCGKWAAEIRGTLSREFGSGSTHSPPLRPAHIMITTSPPFDLQCIGVAAWRRPTGWVSGEIIWGGSAATRLIRLDCCILHRRAAPSPFSGVSSSGKCCLLGCPFHQYFSFFGSNVVCRADSFMLFCLLCLLSPWISSGVATRFVRGICLF